MPSATPVLLAASQAVIYEWRKFPAPPLRLDDLANLLDQAPERRIDKLARAFAESRVWPAMSRQERSRVYLRLAFAAQMVGLWNLATGGSPSPKDSDTWSPIMLQDRLDEACDEAGLLEWMLVRAWRLYGAPMTASIAQSVLLAGRNTLFSGGPTP